MASSGDVELSVVSSRANLEDKDSSGSDSEEEDVKTNEMSVRRLRKQIEDQKRHARQSAIIAREAAKNVGKDSCEALKHAGFLNLGWLVVSMVALAFMSYMAVPEDSVTNTCSEPTLSSKLTKLPLVQFTERKVSHNFGDYDDIGLHRPERLSEIAWAYLVYTIIASLFGLLGTFFPFIFCCCRFTCCLKMCRDIDNPKCYCPYGKCGKIPPTFHEDREVLYYSKQEKNFPRLMISTVIILVLWMVNSGQTEGVIEFVSSGKQIYKLPDPVAKSVKATSPTIQNMIYELGDKGINELLIDINDTLTENFQAQVLLNSLQCLDGIVLEELPKPSHVDDISQSIKSTDIVGDSNMGIVLDSVDNLWTSRSEYFVSLQSTLSSFSSLTSSAMFLKSQSQSILSHRTTDKVSIRNMLSIECKTIDSYKISLQSIVENQPSNSDLGYLENELATYDNGTNNTLVFQKLNGLKTNLENYINPAIAKLVRVLPLINNSLSNMSSVANILPSQVRALTHNLSAQEAAAYKSKLPVLNQSYTYQNIIIKFVQDIVTINTTLVNHDKMADVIEKLTNLGVQRPCLSHLTNTLIHANKTLFEIPKGMMGAIDRVESLNNSRNEIYNSTSTLRHQLSILTSALKSSFFGDYAKKHGVMMVYEDLPKARQLKDLYEGLNGFESWNTSFGIDEVESFKSNQSSLIKTSKLFQVKATELKKAVEDAMVAIDSFLPPKNTTERAKNLRDKIAALKGNFSSTMPQLESYNTNYNDFFAFDHRGFLTMLTTLSSINNPNTTVRENVLNFNETIAQLGPPKQTMVTDLTKVKEALYNITSTGIAAKEADGNIQGLKNAIEDYANSTSIKRATTIVNWFYGFQTRRLQNYTLSVSSTKLIDASSKYDMGKSLDLIYQLLYDLCIDFSNSTLIPNISCVSSVGGMNSKLASRIEDKNNAILPLGGAHYLMKLYKIHEAVDVGAYNTKVDLYNGRTSDDGLRIARNDGSFCYTSECLKNTWGYYIQSQHVAQSEFNVPLRVSAQELPGILYAFPIALSVLAILQCLGFCHYRSDILSCCSCGLCTSYIMSFMAGVILLSFGAALFPLSIFTADACLSLGRSSDKTFAALNPLLCQAIGGKLNGTSLCTITVDSFNFQVDVPSLMKDISSNCKSTTGFSSQWELTSKDMDTNMRKLVDDSMNDPGTFGEFKFKYAFKNAVKRGGKAIGSVLANNTLGFGTVIDCQTVNEIYFNFHSVACCSVFGPIYWIILTWINIALILLCCGCGSAMIGAKRFMSNKDVSIIRKKFGLEVDLEYSLMLSNIKPEEQAQAAQWERERKLLQHHKTKVKTKDVQYYNVISWDLNATRSTRDGMGDYDSY